MVDNTTLINELTVSDDTIGAIVFIIFVLLWYSSSIVFLMGMQIGRSNERIEESLKRPSHLFVQSLRDQTNNKEILKELADRSKRDKLWDIYLGTSGDMHDKITRGEAHRIRNIERRLASLNQPDRYSDQTIADENNLLVHSYSDLHSSIDDSSTSDIRLRTRRRSSLDQKILQQWKILAEEIKLSKNLPWPIQKLLIRRHLRRQRYTSEV